MTDPPGWQELDREDIRAARDACFDEATRCERHAKSSSDETMVTAFTLNTKMQMAVIQRRMSEDNANPETIAQALIDEVYRAFNYRVVSWLQAQGYRSQR